MSRVVTLGEAMVLFLADPGTPLRAATSFRRSVAGAESNVAVGLARLGHEVRFLGRVGADALGDVVLATLRGEGVDVSDIRRDDSAPTGLLVRDAVPERRVEVAYARAGSAASRTTPDDLPSSLEGADLLHLTGITPLLSRSAWEATHALVDRAAEAGVAVSVDPNLRFSLAPADVVIGAARELVARADVVLASTDELVAISGLTAADVEGAPGRAAPDASLVVVKTGEGAVAARRADARGAVADDLDPVRVHEPRVASVDPVGSGDAFDAAFLDAWLRGADLDRALTAGARAGRDVARVPTDLDGLPWPADLDSHPEDVRR